MVGSGDMSRVGAKMWQKIPLAGSYLDNPYNCLTKGAKSLLENLLIKCEYLISQARGQLIYSSIHEGIC